MMKKLLFVIILFECTTLQLFAFDKVGTTSFQFLKVYPGARACGLSGAYSTIANNSDAVFWNPACLTRVNGLDATVNYISWLMDIKHYAFTAAYTMDDCGTFGVQGMVSDIGEIEETKVERIGVGGLVDGMFNPGLTGVVYKPYSMVFGLSYATKLTDRFSFGLTAKYVRENLIYQKSSAFVYDGGFVFDTRFRSIVIGASVRHFGPEVKFVDKYFPLPQTFNIGVSASLFSENDPLITSLGDHGILFSYDMVQPRDYTQLHSVGLEYSYNKILFIRGGYTFNSSQEGLSAGVGFVANNYRVDYSFSDFGEYLNPVQRITIGFNLN